MRVPERPLSYGEILENNRRLNKSYTRIRKTKKRQESERKQLVERSKTLPKRLKRKQDSKTKQAWASYNQTINKLREIYKD